LHVLRGGAGLHDHDHVHVWAGTCEV